MLLIDPNGPMTLQPHITGARRISRPARFVAPTILFLGFATFSANVSRAQDQQDQSVAEAARLERARKQEQQKSAKHVYTEEDLKHANILTPEDRAQIAAKKNECAQKNNCSPAAPQNPPAALDANSQTSGTSLGEVARQLRKQKELQALKPQQSEPFHLPFETPALASPILPERPAIRPPAQQVLRSKSLSTKMPPNVFRRDPFSAVPIRPTLPRAEVHRPEIRPSVRQDVRPEVHADAHTSVRENIRPTVRSKTGSDVQPKVPEDVRRIVRPNIHPDFSKEVRPTLRAHGRMSIPVQPKISSRPTSPKIWIQPLQPSVPAKLAQPATPISTVRPTQSNPAPIPVTTATQKIVTVQHGDSLWKLAQQTLGHGHRYPELLAVNPSVVNPNQIRAGAQLILPVGAASGLVNRSAKTSAATIITVRKGDTLWALAKSTLGLSSAWRRLAAANPSISDPNRIYGGQNLILPTVRSSALAMPLSPSSQSSTARP
jgi:LysM repeat protein